MCGIMGVIGESLNPKISYALLTSLLLKTESRGKEATGFWAAQKGKNGKILYHKEPIPANEFIKNPTWKDLFSFNPNLVIGHCREPTQTSGSPKVNKNNHPFVSNNHQLALVHNGKVEDYYKLKPKYENFINSQCDSEIILRMFEIGENLENIDFLKEKYPDSEPTTANRLFGIEQIFLNINNGAMAAAIAERHKDTKRSLWLFRDQYRPLHIIDLRPCLGQIFFCSTLFTWRDAVDGDTEIKNFLPHDHEIIEFPANYAYVLNIDENAKEEDVTGGWKKNWKIGKYKIEKTRVAGDKCEEFPSLKKKEIIECNVEVISKLNNEDEIVEEKKEEPLEETVIEKPIEEKSNQKEVKIEVTNIDDEYSYDIEKFDTITKGLKELIEEISTLARNAAMETSIMPTDFQQLTDDLEQVLADLTSSKLVTFKAY